jgi:hypothetical protein
MDSDEQQPVQQAMLQVYVTDRAQVLGDANAVRGTTIPLEDGVRLLFLGAERYAHPGLPDLLTLAIDVTAGVSVHFAAERLARFIKDRLGHGSPADPTPVKNVQVTCVEKDRHWMLSVEQSEPELVEALVKALRCADN